MQTFKRQTLPSLIQRCPRQSYKSFEHEHSISKRSDIETKLFEVVLSKYCSQKKDKTILMRAFKSTLLLKSISVFISNILKKTNKQLVFLDNKNVLRKQYVNFPFDHKLDFKLFQAIKRKTKQKQIQNYSTVPVN